MQTPAWIITADELKKCKDQVTLVDVREPEEYEESHIEGCILIPMGEIQNRAPELLKPEQDIVLYCAHGYRSLQALMSLKMLGFEKLRSLEGGIEAWHQAGT